MEEKATDLAYFDYAILPISKEAEGEPLEPGKVDNRFNSWGGDLAKNSTPNQQSYNRGSSPPFWPLKA